MSWAEVNKINSDMTTPLNATLGNRSHTAATAPTSSLFSWVKAVHSHLLTNMSAARMVRIDTISNAPVISSGVVRSVQQGTANGDLNNLRTINIGAINPSRAIVLLNGHWGLSSSTPTVPHLYSLTATSISIHGLSGTSTRYAFSWQVIEFN